MALESTSNSGPTPQPPIPLPILVDAALRLMDTEAQVERM